MTLLWIKAFWPIIDCVEYDSMLFFSMVCLISIWTFDFFYKIYEVSNLLEKKKFVQKEHFLE